MNATNTPTPSWVVANRADRLFRSLRRDFLADLRVHLLAAGVAAVSIRRGTRLLYDAGSGRVGEVHLHAYARPSSRSPDQPLIVRVALNRDFFYLPRAAVRGLGVVPARVSRGWMPETCEGDKLELSLLPEQLLSFVPWVAVWVRGRARLATPEELVSVRRPPHRLDRNEDDPLVANYLWTVDAAATHDAWSRSRQERLQAMRTG